MRSPERLLLSARPDGVPVSPRSLRVAALAAGLAVVGGGERLSSAQPATQGSPKAVARAVTEADLPAIGQWQLKNGLTVAHVERPGLPMATVQVWYRFGSVDEPKGQHGAARAFERLMFLGSAKLRPEDHRRYIEQVGGETSALATEDVTAFHESVPVAHLNLALQLEAERMRSLLIRTEAVEGIRPAMVDDLRRQEASPVYRAYQRLLTLAFAGHPYAYAPLGVAGEIQRLDAAQLKALYDTYYVPSNALVVVVGGVSRDAVDKAVERWFGPLALAPAPTHAAAAMNEPSAPVRETLPGGSGGLVMAGYRLPPASDADVLALQVAGAILTSGPSSRLYRRLVAGKQADEVGGQVLVRRDGGVLVAFARFGGAAAPVEKTLVAEIDRLAKGGPTAAELRRAKGQILGAAWLGMEGATGLANQIGVSWGLTGKPDAFLADLAALDGLSAADVRRATTKYLASARQVLVVADPAAAPSAGAR